MLEAMKRSITHFFGNIKPLVKAKSFFDLFLKHVPEMQEPNLANISALHKSELFRECNQLPDYFIATPAREKKRIYALADQHIVHNETLTCKRAALQNMAALAQA